MANGKSFTMKVRSEKKYFSLDKKGSVYSWLSCEARRIMFLYKIMPLKILFNNIKL